MHFKKIIITIMGLSSIGFAQANMTTEIETFWLWIALFSLGIVGIAILFITSYQTQKIQKLHQSMFDKQLEMEKNQNLLLTNMSENIYNMVKQSLQKNPKVFEKTSQLLKDKQNVLVDVESRLLDVTNDLLDFLRLKSKKVEIINEEFNINNVLNELSGSICSQFSGSEIELIFDIDKNVPRHLVGDSLHLGQTLKSILEYMMEQVDLDEVRLEISMFDTFEEQVELQFHLSDTGRGLNKDTLQNLFTPYYDEESGNYVGLGLFVAHELVHMMDGHLSVQGIEEKGTTFILTLPFKIVEKSNQRKYRLPEKVLIEKKVFIVDNNYNSALAVKKMFAYFRHEVTVITLSEFMKNIPNLTPFDIVVLNENLFTMRLINYLNKIKMEKEFKVIALNSLLHSNKKSFVNEVIDTHLFKPLNQERVFELIVNMFEIKVPVQKGEEEKDTTKQVQTYKEGISETKGVTQHSFKDFSGKNILIAEDNVINQKVLMSLLRQSGMSISIANNGQEAVDILKESEVEFDLVLMDINMPIMDGYTATQMIRLNSKFDTLPIVAFTALVLDSEVQKMFNCGINAFLAKPLNIGKLYTAFNVYFSDKNVLSSKQEKVETKEDMTCKNINIKKGIKHSNNNDALYREVLKEFTEAYGTSDEVFVKLIHEHRYEQVKMLCVDMRGLTGTIGADDMYALVTEILNRILYKKYDLLANYIEKYKSELQTLNHSIDQYVNAA